MATTLPSRPELFKSMQPLSIANVSDTTTSIDTCGICLGDLAEYAKTGESELAVRLHGTHVYGEDCIRRWLRKNNSCPNCRQQVHGGSPYDIDQLLSLGDEQQRHLVLDLCALAHHMQQQQTPGIKSPIIDSDVYHFISRLQRLLEVVDRRRHFYMLERALTNLMAWRSFNCTDNPAYFTMPEFTPYTSTGSLRAIDLDTDIVVREDEAFSLILDVFNEGSSQKHRRRAKCMSSTRGSTPTGRRIGGLDAFTARNR